MNLLRFSYDFTRKLGLPRPSQKPPRNSWEVLGSPWEGSPSELRAGMEGREPGSRDVPP